MINHLRAKHAEKYKSYESENEVIKQKKPLKQTQTLLLSELTKTGLTLKVDSSMKSFKDNGFINDQILEFIFLDMQPFNIGNGFGFRKLMKFLAPHINRPSPNHLSQKLLPEIYDKIVNSLKIQLKHCRFMAATTDIWTYLNMDAYLSFTAHLINDNWERKHYVLSVRPFNISHTSDNILKEFNIKF